MVGNKWTNNIFVILLLFSSISCGKKGSIPFLQTSIRTPQPITVNNTLG